MRACLTNITIALLLAACGSSPKTNFYTLSVVPGRTGGSPGNPVQLSAVHLPPMLDRQQMVRLTSANTVEISETNRWSASFEDMVRNVLAQDLVARLPGTKVILPEAPAPNNTSKLVITMSQFGPDASSRVKLEGSWTLLSATGNGSVTDHNFRIDTGIAATPDATAAAMSQALGQLADKIARSF